jgi:hypothetical protein
VRWFDNFTRALARRRLAVLIACALVQSWLWLGPLAQGRLGVELGGKLLALTVASVAWAVAVVVVGREPVERDSAGREPIHRAAPRLATALWILATGLALRGMAWSTDLEASDDLWRYAYEGALVLEGESPYAWAPADPERASQRERWAELAARVGHPEVSAAYPPVAQAIFAGVMVASGTLVLDPEEGRTWLPPPNSEIEGSLRWAALVADALAWGLIVGAARGLQRWRLAVAWGWSPLVLLAFGASGHFDVYGIAALWLGLLLLGKREQPADARPTAQAWAGVALGIGAAIKFLPALPLLATGADLRRVRRFAVATALTASVWVLALEAGSRGLTRGLANYGERWSSTNLLFRWIERGAWWTSERLAPVLGGELLGPGGALAPGRLARLVVLVLFLGAIAKTRKERIGPRATAGALLGAFTLLTPTLHPWYLCWWLPFAVERGRVGPLLLLIAGPLLYAPVGVFQAGGEWHEPAWLWPAVLGPIALVILVEVPWTLRSSLERLRAAEARPESSD